MRLHRKLVYSAFIIFFLGLARQVAGQGFIHPGINQSAKDLAYMKQLVLKKEAPWKEAFDRLKASADTAFTVRPHTHVLRGPYGRPNIGGDDLSRSANMAYNYALVWYITEDSSYARKAINILNSWSPALWDFDYNDAKLLAAWTGHLLCNAAEILRYTRSGWRQQEIDRFTQMLLTVYYPLMRYYYPQANGNWDGAIIHSILAIAIFTDNRKMFDNAVDHFLHGPVNGSLFKYIYPSGQCQESLRDQGHVQLGLGEFAGAAQVAWTQDVDLFSIGNNRIGLGYEYTAGFLLGQKPFCYGPISERAKILRDDYEYVYRHYAAQGIELPFTKRAADSVRGLASRSILSSVRVPAARSGHYAGTPLPSSIAYMTGADGARREPVPANAIMVASGQPVQNALDDAAGKGLWVVLKSGVHTLPHTLKIPSGITLVGEGRGTVLFLDPASGEREAMVNAENGLHDVVIRDLVIEGGIKTEVPSDPNSSRSYRGGYNRGGILFRAEKEGDMNNLSFINLTVQNCTYTGISISGAARVSILRCDLTENGASAIPGPRLVHNLLLTHCSGITISESRLDTSPFGSGVALADCKDATIQNSEIARNGYYGVLVSECRNVTIKGNLIEGNDRSGTLVEFLQQGSENIRFTGNRVQFNGGYGLESYAARNSRADQNIYEGNAGKPGPEKISKEKLLIME